MKLATPQRSVEYHGRMALLPRPPRIHHCTSEPFRFFGRGAELTLLNRAFEQESPSVVALVGPGGQGKTAIVQHWLQGFETESRRADAVFLWSFYRAKDVDVCLRALYAYALGVADATDVSASYCVDHLLDRLRRERWAVVLDGAEVVQYEAGNWYGRFTHPELGRLLEELASAPMPGVVAVTSRFPLTTLHQRRHARQVSLTSLDAGSARGLLRSLGVRGTDDELDAVATWCGEHAKAVELVGTYLVRYRQGEARSLGELPAALPSPGASAEEQRVASVLAVYKAALSAEALDLLALATAFRQPPAEQRLLHYLASEPVRRVLHETWRRTYVPFRERPEGWLAQGVNELIALRLLERVGPIGETVIDAHPLVRRGFEDVLGSGSHQHSAQARAGFLRGRPDRRPPNSLEDAREEVELFHAYCDAELWNEADSTYVALDNPKHRFLAPRFERELLLRFFPDGDWRRPPLWAGFGRYRSLAICCEMLGDYVAALEIYRPADAALRGDALIALGRLDPLLEQPHMPSPWQALWHAYRAHALCLAGRVTEAVGLARSLVPVDVYEWVHVFECLLRAGQMTAVDLSSILYCQQHAPQQQWSNLAWRRMRADYRRATGNGTTEELEPEYRALVAAYDRGGLPYERALVRLSFARWLSTRGQLDQAVPLVAVAATLARRHRMPIIEVDALELEAAAAQQGRDAAQTAAVLQKARRQRVSIGYTGPQRP
jgi:hypothetical protein